MKSKNENICPLCNGSKKEGTKNFSVELGFGVVVVRNVPAKVCAQCGADWISDDASERLEKIVDDARQKHNQVEVSAFA